MELVYLGAFLLMWYGIGKWCLEAIRIALSGFKKLLWGS